MIDESGIVVTCPLCWRWSVQVAYTEVGWPLAGDLIEQAIAEHVDEHVAREWSPVDPPEARVPGC